MQKSINTRFKGPVAWTFIVWCLLMGLGSAIIEKDGIWSTRDFSNFNLDYEIVNGMLVPEAGTEFEERMNSARMRDPALADCSESGTNVQLIKTLLTEEQYNYIFPARAESMTYEVFLEAASLFPMFCGEFVSGTFNADTAEKACKRELATFFAHVSHTTGTNGGWLTGLTYLYDTWCAARSNNWSCKKNNVQTRYWPVNRRKAYYGRGPLGLATNEHYGMFSQHYYQDRHVGHSVLLNNPDTLCTDALRCWVSGFWRYMIPYRPRPSVHSIVIGTY